MRRLLSLLVMLMGVPALPALAIDLPDPNSPNYRELPLMIEDKGAIYQSVKTTKTETKSGNTTTTHSTSRYRNDFTATDAGYKVKKTLVAFTVTGPNGKVIDQDAQTTEALVLKTMLGAFTELTFHGDESLSPQSLDDWPTLWKNTRSLIGTALDANGKAPTLDEKTRAMAVIDRMFGNMTPEQAAQTFLQVDTMIAMPHNLALETGKPLSVDSEIVSPVGNFPIAISETFVITHWNEAGNTAQITYDYRPRPESLKAFLHDFLPKFMKDAGAPPETSAEMEQAMKASPADVFDMTTHCDYDVAIDTGLARKGKCTRTININLMGQAAKKIEVYDFSESFEP